MINYTELESKIKSMIRSLQGLCNQKGLTNTASEEIIVTSVFLYKFLNDKFIANFKSFIKEIEGRELSQKELSEKMLKYSSDEDMMSGFYDN